MISTRLPLLHPSLVTDSLERAGAGDGDGRGMLVGQVRGFGREQTLGDRYVLGEGTRAGAEHVVALAEPGDTLADGLDATCHLLTRDAGLGAEEAELRADRIREARDDMPVADEDTRRMTLTSTSPIAAVGRSMSTKTRLSAVPYTSWTIAFIRTSTTLRRGCERS